MLFGRNISSNNHDDLEDYVKTLKYAYLYAKTVTLVEHIGQKPIELC